MMVSLRFPSFFVCFLIFIAWMHYKKRKATKQQEKESSLFWEREEEANHTRNKDISHLPLFTPDITRIPWEGAQNDTILHYLDALRHLIESPMMDLSEYTNTDLKIAYGIGNFQTLSTYDETYQNFFTDSDRSRTGLYGSGRLYPRRRSLPALPRLRSEKPDCLSFIGRNLQKRS